MTARVRPGALVLAAMAFVLMIGGAALAQGDPEQGEKVFNKCKACHTLEPGKNKIGPSLAGVFGRQAGTVEGFNYSSAMKESGIVWTEQTISAYLENPKDFIPGNKMLFPGMKTDSERADVIAYLKQEAQ